MCGLFRAIKLSGQWNIAALLGNQQKAFEAEGCLLCRFRDWLHGEFQLRFWNKWNWRFGMTSRKDSNRTGISSLGKRAEKCEKIPRNRNGILAWAEIRHVTRPLHDNTSSHATKLTTWLQHEWFRVNQAYSTLRTLMYVKKKCCDSDRSRIQ